MNNVHRPIKTRQFLPQSALGELQHSSPQHPGRSPNCLSVSLCFHTSPVWSTHVLLNHQIISPTPKVTPKHNPCHEMSPQERLDYWPLISVRQLHNRCQGSNRQMREFSKLFLTYYDRQWAVVYKNIMKTILLDQYSTNIIYLKLKKKKSSLMITKSLICKGKKLPQFSVSALYPLKICASSLTQKFCGFLPPVCCCCL